MKFDDILTQIGEFGPYQKRVYILVCLTTVTCAMQTFLPVFVMGIPEYRCKLPWLQNDTYDIRSDNQRYLVNLTVPLEMKDGEKVHSKCYLYDVGNLSFSEIKEDDNLTQKQCDSWVYDSTSYESTAITEFRMVCGNEILRSHLNMITFGGSFTAALSFGAIADLLGRKKAFIVSIIMQLGSGLGLAFAPDFMAYAVFRFTTGLSNMAVFMIAFVIGLELVGPSKRTTVGIVIELFWCIGLLVLAGVAYALRDWRHLQLALTVPSALFLPYWWLIPESPRWLLSKGRLKEAEEILLQVAESNKTKLPKDIIYKVSLDEGPTMKIWHMFTSPVLIIRTLVLFFNWLAINLVYYGLGLNVGNLSGNVYLNFTLSSSVEVAGYVGCLILLHLTGRKVLHCFSMLLGGVACLATIFPVVYGDKSHEWVTVFLAMVGKFGSSAAFAVIYVFSAELFPTIIRQSGIGCCSIFEGVGGMIAPYIADLGILVGGQLADALPMIVFGSVTVAAGLLSLLLPETRNKKLPETIEDAIIFGRENDSDSSRDNKMETEYKMPVTALNRESNTRF